MTFWIILIAAVLIGLVWRKARARQNNDLDMTNNKNNVHYHLTHLATEASEELTPEMPNSTNNNMVQQKQNQTTLALTLYDPSSVNNNKNDGVYYHQTHLAAQTAQTDSSTGGIPASEEGIQKVQQQIEASYQQSQEQNKEPK